jgi:hypothetical protein
LTDLRSNVESDDQIVLSAEVKPSRPKEEYLKDPKARPEANIALADVCSGTLAFREEEMEGISYDSTSLMLDEPQPAVTVTARVVRYPSPARHKRLVLEVHRVASHAENPSLADSDGFLIAKAAHVTVKLGDANVILPPNSV